MTINALQQEPALPPPLQKIESVVNESKTKEMTLAFKAKINEFFLIAKDAYLSQIRAPRTEDDHKVIGLLKEIEVLQRPYGEALVEFYNGKTKKSIGLFEKATILDAKKIASHTFNMPIESMKVYILGKCQLDDNLEIFPKHSDITMIYIHN